MFHLSAEGWDALQAELADAHSENQRLREENDRLRKELARHRPVVHVYEEDFNW
jgi:regulator of replication initiation timing